MTTAEQYKEKLHAEVLARLVDEQANAFAQALRLSASAQRLSEDLRREGCHIDQEAYQRAMKEIGEQEAQSQVLAREADAIQEKAALLFDPDEIAAPISERKHPTLADVAATLKYVQSKSLLDRDQEAALVAALGTIEACAGTILSAYTMLQETSWSAGPEQNYINVSLSTIKRIVGDI